MKRPRRSVAISLFVALAVASAFVVAIAGCSGRNDEASTSALEGLDASQVKDDNLKTLNVDAARIVDIESGTQTNLKQRLI